MAKVNFKRIEDSSSIDQYNIEDGTFWVTGDGKTYVDYGTERIAVAGTPDAQMSDISRNTVENKVIKQYVDNEIENSKQIITTVWENPNPNQAFVSQTITLSSDDYDYLEIYYYDWNEPDRGYKHLLCEKVLKGYSTQMMMSLVYNNKGYSGTRRFVYQNDTTYLVGTGYTVINDSQLTAQIQNTWNVPIKIIAYKYQ